MLPDSQMDRFTIRLSLGYPSPKDEMAMVVSRQGANPLKNLMPLLSRAELAALQEEVERTYLHEAVIKYIVDLITATRNSEDIERGASPRATLSVTAMAKAAAQIRGRDYVIPADVREVFSWTVAHRLILSSKAEGLGKTAEEILKEIVERTPSPKLK